MNEVPEQHGPFATAARAYRRARPGYPDGAVAALTRAFDVRPGGHVVDLGAGTGLFSRQLAAHGFRVTAVEPSSSMRSKIPTSEYLAVQNGTAEATGLPDACADAVVAATSWHWFDPSRAIRETRRLLAPGGGLGLLWNLYDESVPWVAEYADITHRRRPSSSPSARDGAWRAFFDRLDGWEPLTEVQLPNPRSTSPTLLIDRLMSSSVIALLDQPQREEVRAEAWHLLRRHGLADLTRMTLPYVTLVCWTRPSDR